MIIMNYFKKAVVFYFLNFLTSSLSSFSLGCFLKIKFFVIKFKYFKILSRSQDLQPIITASGIVSRWSHWFWISFRQSLFFRFSCSRWWRWIRFRFCCWWRICFRFCCWWRIGCRGLVFIGNLLSVTDYLDAISVKMNLHTNYSMKNMTYLSGIISNAIFPYWEYWLLAAYLSIATFPLKNKFKNFDFYTFLFWMLWYFFYKLFLKNILHAVSFGIISANIEC